mmetsp:Transcript_695/g.2220  ORF Transcript_695/g.2220 Transcript_695/m.2220 type:complete len:213 (-) Transcript_695:263-901(-)
MPAVHVSTAPPRHVVGEARRSSRRGCQRLRGDGCAQGRLARRGGGVPRSRIQRAAKHCSRGAPERDSAARVREQRRHPQRAIAIHCGDEQWVRGAAAARRSRRRLPAVAGQHRGTPVTSRRAYPHGGARRRHKGRRGWRAVPVRGAARAAADHRPGPTGHRVRGGWRPPREAWRPEPLPEAARLRLPPARREQTPAGLLTRGVYVQIALESP